MLVGIALVLGATLPLSCNDNSGCGDGLKEPQEECDGIEVGGATCTSLGYYEGSLSCKTDCTFDLTECAAAGRCGDGIINKSKEQCDQDNLGKATCESLGLAFGSLTCTEGCRLDASACCGDGRVGGE
ncbi:MAG: hypothetical protein V2A73_14265, partial [Pseudomonadota bacterium]